VIPLDAIPRELLIFTAALAAGAFGALVGIGGGLVLVPVLSTFLGVDLHTAIGVSLLGVIAVSTSASPSYLRSGLVDRRIGIALLVATALGGVAGGYVAGLLDDRVLAGVFAAVLVLVALQMFLSRRGQVAEVLDEPGRLEYDWSYVEPTTGEHVAYRARKLGTGMGASVGAGALSGLLGVGGGVVNVPTMNVLMGIPIRVATTTSTYMLAPTAAASAVLYVSRGDVLPLIAAPVVVGVVIGGRIGARLSHRLPHQALTVMFVAVAAVLALQMTLRALGSP
jgi:uncharacterized membrane protein YfcA